jgi:hypothetical protein
MTTATLERQSRSTATAIFLGVAGMVALLFVAAAALPYYSLDVQRFGPYWPKRYWLLTHITGGVVALLVGPVQLWLGLRNRAIAWHRRLGVVYMSSIVISAIAAYYLATHTDFGWVFGAGLAALATAWLLTTGMALLAVQRALYDVHKEWMIRSYVVTFAFVTFRAMQVSLAAAGVGTLQEQLALSSWFCWAVPLLVTEVILQGRKVLAVPRV